MNALGQAPVGVTVFAGQSLVDSPSSSLSMAFGLSGAAVCVLEVTATLPMVFGVFGVENAVQEVSGSLQMLLSIAGSALTLHEVLGNIQMVLHLALPRIIVYEDGVVVDIDFSTESAYGLINVQDSGSMPYIVVPDDQVSLPQITVH